jgi:hypothetical protein
VIESIQWRLDEVPDAIRVRRSIVESTRIGTIKGRMGGLTSGHAPMAVIRAEVGVNFSAQTACIKASTQARSHSRGGQPTVADICLVTQVTRSTPTRV